MNLGAIIQTLAIYALPVLFAITLHEAAHGYVARHYGDLTAYAQGRISLNPLRHIDLLGTVVVPLLRPAIVGGWLLVFLIAFHELTMSSLLYGPGTDTVAVAVLNLQQLGDVPVSSALAVILTLPLIIAAVPLLATGRLSRRLLGNG